MKHVFLAVCILSGCLLPCTAVFFLMLFNSVAMGPAFAVSFTIENRTGEEIRVTPVGAVGGSGYRSRLPTLITPIPAFPHFRDGDYRIAPGGSVVVHYDFDDINFSEIVVTDLRGRLRQFVVNPEPLKNQYHAPAAKLFVIEDLDALIEPPPEVQRPVQAKSRAWVVWLVMILGVLALPVFILSRRAYRARSASVPASAGA